MTTTTAAPARRVNIVDARFKATTPTDPDTGSTGEFEAIVSVFGVRDRYGDVVTLGAFTGSLEQWAASGDPLPVIWSHQWADPAAHIGVVLEAAELAPGDPRLPDDLADLGGLWVRGRLDLDAPDTYAGQVHRLLLARRVTQFSFAFDVLEHAYVPGNDEHDAYTELRKLALLEVGPCLLGVNSDTDLLTAKADQPDTTQDDPQEPASNDHKPDQPPTDTPAENAPPSATDAPAAGTTPDADDVNDPTETTKATNTAAPALAATGDRSARKAAREAAAYRERAKAAEARAHEAETKAAEALARVVNQQRAAVKAVAAAGLRTNLSGMPRDDEWGRYRLELHDVDDFGRYAAAPHDLLDDDGDVDAGKVRAELHRLYSTRPWLFKMTHTQTGQPPATLEDLAALGMPVTPNATAGKSITGTLLAQRGDTQ